MDINKLNSHFKNLPTDYLYHLGFDSNQDLKSMFGDIKYVIFTRSFNNADMIASEFIKKIYQIKNINITCKTIGKNERYHIHKIHNCLIVSHGIGNPSLLICLNEITKLLWHSGVDKPKYLRIGPAGGLGVDVGTIVFGTHALNNKLESMFTNIECGEIHNYPAAFNKEFSEKIAYYNKDTIPIFGKIIGGMDYYNGQARLNGAMPLTYTRLEQKSYLQKAHAANVRSFDMEALGFAAFCQNIEIPACEINAILVDRIHSDQIDIPKDAQIEIFCHAVNLAINYIIGSNQ